MLFSTFFSSTGGVTTLVVGVEVVEEEEKEEDVGVVVGLLVVVAALSPPYCWTGNASSAFLGFVSSTTASIFLGSVVPPVDCLTEFSEGGLVAGV